MNNNNSNNSSNNSSNNNNNNNNNKRERKKERITTTWNCIRSINELIQGSECDFSDFIIAISLRYPTGGLRKYGKTQTTGRTPGAWAGCGSGRWDRPWPARPTAPTTTTVGAYGSRNSASGEPHTALAFTQGPRGGPPAGGVARCRFLRT